MFVSINGVEQWVTIRGHDARNPVVLYLHGGPGFPTSQLAPGFTDWEEHVTLVQWDQPGGGATYAKNIGKDIGPLTIARYRNDGIAITEFVRDHLHADKVILYGVSWGTMLGLELVHARPELYSAFVGVSQSVGARGELLGYELALQAAKDRSDAEAITALERVGKPPYKSFEDWLVRAQYVSPPGLPLKPEEEARMTALIQALSAPPDPNASYIAKGLPEYSGVEVFLATQAQTFDERQYWDAWKLGTEFQMPVFIFNGEYDINTPTSLAMEFCDDAVAPQKSCEVVPGAGHSTMPNDVLLSLLKERVLPAVSPAR